MREGSGHCRIAVDCRLFGASGIGTFIESVVTYMAADTSRHLTLIGDARRLQTFEDLDNCTITDCRHKPFSLNELLRFPVGVVNSCDAFFTPNFNIPMGIRVPVYSMVHDIVFFDTENFGTPLRRRIIKWYVRRALAISHTVFTVSQFSRERIRKRFNTDADIRVVYNGVGAGLKEYAEQKPTGRTEKHGIVFVGNMKRHKGIRTLLLAHNLLINEGVDVPLTIIGNINFRTRDDELIQLLADSTQVDNAGLKVVRNADNGEVYRLISEAEVLVSPSLYEGFGLPPLEALYLGTKVLISDIPVYKEVYGKLQRQGLPITFFHTEDADDLCKKIKELRALPADSETKSLARHRQLIDETYNFRHVAKRIMEHIT